MEITKANDIFVATVNNPNATTYDLTTLNLTPDNTGLLTKDEYKESKFVQDSFKTSEGKFDDIAFNNAYNVAASHYLQMTDDNYIKSLSEIQYSPFDVTRPKNAKTFNISVEFSKDYNPFKQLYGRSGINSIDDNPLSLRELAQQEKVFDPKSGTWSQESANDLGLVEKFFGDTMVYAQWDEDGTHTDFETGRTVNHRKGDWKTNENGNLYLEKLAGREIYGKQVINPMDMLTTDGSFANNFDFYDSDDREKSAIKTTFKIAADIAPLLIPGFNTYYAGVKAAASLASVMPTFYKSLEGILLGDQKSSLTDIATAAEGYLAKYTTQSFSDAAQGSMFNYEQMGSMVASIFSQIYEQRAMASLSKYLIKNPVNIAATEQKYLGEINKNVLESIKGGKISLDDIDAIKSIRNAAIDKVPSLKAFQQTQSQLAKSLSLGYMALTSTSDIYGEAIQGGYDRRTAGFAALASAAGQYGIMMNNRMGDWMLDKTTGYTAETNKALIRKSVKQYLEPIKEAFQTKNVTESKVKLASIFKNIKNSLYDTFTSPSELGEAMFKNAFIEGVQEVTEQMVQDATKGIIDTMSYLGLTEKQGSFGGFDTVFSKEGFENYLANFVGGILGGAMFEFNTSKLEPLITGKAVSKDTRHDIYQLVGNGQTDLLIDEINRQRSKLGNKYITANSNQDDVVPNKEGEGKSQADLIADTAIGMVKNIDGIMNSMNFTDSDEDIIKKAMIDHLIIKDLNASKGTGKIGIEGIILDDYRNAVSRVMDIQLELQKLTTTDQEKEDNKKSIKELKEESKFYEDKINDIKEGKYAEKYFTQAIFYLSKPISDSWLTIDKDTYAKNKYGVNFKSLPETGLGLNQQRIEKEWKEYLNSKDIRKDIEVATNAYLNLEKEINPSIEEYVKSGYDVQRVRTYQNLIDLDSTIKSFNTAQSEEEKVALLERFKYISEQLKELGGDSKLNILPWDVYKQDLGKKIIEYGMIGKASLNENGEYLMNQDTKDIVGTPFNQDELSAQTEGGLKLSDALEKQVSILFSEVPLNPLDMDASIKILNTMIVSHNNKVNAEILSLSSKAELTEEDNIRLQELQSSKYDFILLPYNNSTEVIAKRDQIKSELANMYNDLQNDHNISQNIIEKYNSNSYYDTESEENKQEISNLEWLINANQSTIDQDFIDNLTEAQIESFENSKLNSGLNQDKDLLNRLIEAKESFVIGKTINDNIDIIEEFSNKEIEIYNNFENEINASKPELLKMRNYALDLLIDEIQGSDKNSPSQDAEVINEAKKIVTGIVNGFNIKFLPNFKFDSIEDLVYIVNNINDITDKINNSKILNIIEVDPDTDEEYTIIDYSKEAFDKENIDDIFNKYITSDKNVNFEFISGLNNIKKNFSSISGLDQVNKFLELNQKLENKIDNPLYKFLENFELSLQKKINQNSPSVFNILEREEKALLSASDVNNFLTEGVKLNDIRNALNVLKLIKSSVFAMNTTQVGFDDPYGFIASRQNFLKKYGIDSETNGLKTITSDAAQLMLADLTRIEVKLQFYLDLAKFNSAKVKNEQETIRNRMNEILYKKLKDLTSKDIFKNLKPKFEEIDKNKSISQERKLLEFESAIYEEFKDSNKKEVLKELLKESQIKIDGRKLSKLDKEVTIDSIIDYDFAIYLATSMTIYGKDFDSKMHSILQDFDKAPFFTQEMAVKTAYASLVDPDLFSSIVELDNDSPEKNTTDLITFILGGGGTGKTTVVFKMLLKYLQKNNKSISLWFVGPEQDQADKLHDDVLKNVQFVGTKDSFSKIKLYDKLGIKDTMMKIITDLENGNDDSEFYTWEKVEGGNSIIKLKQEVLESLLSKAFKDDSGVINQNLPNLIFIDEITHFSSLELEILNTLVKSLPKENFIKIVTAGDTSQNGFRYGNDEHAMDLNVDRVKGIFSSKLITSLRAANIWKKENNDLTNTLSEKIADIYHDETIDDNVRFTKIKELLDVYKSEKLFNLKYYKSDTELNGDIIESKLSDNTLNTLKNILSNPDNSDKVVGILTEDGEVGEYKDALTKLGLIDKDGNISDRVKLFSYKKVQGNEVDYFIFNTNLIKSSAAHHQLKEFYTFISRAKEATIIIDSQKIQEKYNIFNSVQTENDKIEPLNSEVIEDARNKRISVLEGLLDNKFDIKYDNFVFENVEQLEPSEIDDTIYKGDGGSLHSETDEDAEKVADDYNYMFHTFYNNPNVKVKQIVDGLGKVVGTEIEQITYDPSNNNTDLNIDKVSKEDTQKIVNGWLNLKNGYTYSKKIPSDKETKKFLGIIFNETNIIPSTVETSVVLTATKFNSSTNLSAYKTGFDLDKTLNDGDPFINVSLRLEKNGKVHYITLSTISANTIASAFGKDSKSNELYEAVVKKLKTEDLSEIKEIATDIEFDNQITSVRFLKGIKDSKTFVKDTNNTHRGIKKSDNVNFFPTDEQAFYDLLNKFTFGDKKRTIEDRTAKTANGKEYTIHGLKSLYAMYKGKPYITISYDSSQLGGSVSGNTQARLVPLFSQSRSFDETRNQLNDLRALYFNSIKEGSGVTKEDIDKISKTFKNLVSTTQMIDLLISVSEQYPEAFDRLLVSNNIFKSTPLDALLKVVGKKNKDAIKYQLDRMFKYIKDNRGKDPKDIKKGLTPLFTDNVWKNYISNLFVLDNLIEQDKKSTKNEDEIKIYEEMIKSVRDFHSAIKAVTADTGIYWETPKAKNKAVSVYEENSTNEIVKKLQPYQPESFLYFNGVPESPRFLLNLEEQFNNYLNGTIEQKPEEKKEKKEKKETKKKETKEKKKEEKKITPVPPVSNVNSFEKLSSEYVKDLSNPSNYWRYKVSELFKGANENLLNTDELVKHIYDSLNNPDLIFEVFLKDLIKKINPNPAKSLIIASTQISSTLANILGKDKGKIHEAIKELINKNNCK